MRAAYGGAITTTNEQGVSPSRLNDSGRRRLHATRLPTGRNAGRLSFGAALISSRNPATAPDIELALRRLDTAAISSTGRDQETVSQPRPITHSRHRRTLMSSDDTSHDQADDTTPETSETSETNGPDANVCNAGSETPFGLNEHCPDCRARAGVECDWSCSSNWN